jgi:hypothetical protein
LWFSQNSEQKSEYEPDYVPADPAKLLERIKDALADKAAKPRKRSKRASSLPDYACGCDMTDNLNRKLDLIEDILAER